MPEINSNHCSFSHRAPAGDVHACAALPQKDSEYCIFHDPNPVKDAQEFTNQFAKFILPPRQHWDCSGFVFPRGLSSDFFLKYSFPIVSFIDAKFYSEFESSGVHSSIHCLRAEFFEKVKMAGTFLGSAIFSGATFHSEADFSLARFNTDPNVDGKTDFSGVRFIKNANFCAAEFHHGATFGMSRGLFTGFERETRFIEGVNFSSSIFGNNNGCTYFDNAVFNGVTDFTGAEIAHEIKFRGTQFNGPVNFSLAKINTRLQFMGNEDFKVFLDEAWFGNLTNVSASNLSFQGVSLKKAVFCQQQLSLSAFQQNKMSGFQQF